MDENAAKIRISKRVALDISERSKNKDIIINLGIGLPTQVPDYVSSDRVFIHTENGMLGVGPEAKPGEEDRLLIDAGRKLVTETNGCSYFGSDLAFGMMRGGHLDFTVLGAYEVDEKGNLASWTIPGAKKLGVGGSMDVVNGAKQVYIATLHTNKKGKAKLIPRCTLPFTGFGKVSAVFTEYAVFRFRDGKMILEEIAPEITLEELKSVTSAEYTVSPDLKVMPLN
jgi:3-oxoacid CoA-transferase B subunit